MKKYLALLLLAACIFAKSQVKTDYKIDINKQGDTIGQIATIVTNFNDGSKWTDIYYYSVNQDWTATFHKIWFNMTAEYSIHILPRQTIIYDKDGNKTVFKEPETYNYSDINYYDQHSYVTYYDSNYNVIGYSETH